jgi:hypothetical protein
MQKLLLSDSLIAGLGKAGSASASAWYSLSLTSTDSDRQLAESLVSQSVRAPLPLTRFL